MGGAPVASWTETRGLVLRADGEALVVTRGAAPLMSIPTALDALSGNGLALWLAGVTWQPPRGLPWLRRIRLLVRGEGSWEAARAAYGAQWSKAGRG